MDAFDADDFDAAQAARAAAQRMSGWNGSLAPAPVEHGPLRKDPPRRVPSPARERLQAVRVVCEQRAAEQRAKGQCL
jgi:hypothetical protein